jgi:hypothetical protein
VVRARLAPLLPGALLAPHLLALHTKLTYLVQPKGFTAGDPLMIQQAEMIMQLSIAGTAD